MTIDDALIQKRKFFRGAKTCTVGPLLGKNVAGLGQAAATQDFSKIISHNRDRVCFQIYRCNNIEFFLLMMRNILSCLWLLCRVPFTEFAQLQLNSGQWFGLFYLSALSTRSLQLLCRTSSHSGRPNPCFIAFVPWLFEFMVAICIFYILILEMNSILILLAPQDINWARFQLVRGFPSRITLLVVPDV